eukprot:GHVN01100153.1.p1 GENE.GHVN01100153.1~~GHVN01100153.1.p1  ORF type:complete len:665 (+),score=2.57 GHVN01100153.1:132-2126(+)
MKTSIPDTFISSRLWNFCEVTSLVPTEPEQSFNYCRKTNTFPNLGFVDVPPLRIIVDVSKSDKSHSSTVPGKVSMLANRMRTPREQFIKEFHLASYLQDGYLRSARSPEPKYLPSIMGGSACPPLFGAMRNLYLYVRAYKVGLCERIYGSCTRELRSCLDSLDMTRKTRLPVLCPRIRDKQEYLHGTYDDKIFIPTKVSMDAITGQLPPPLFKATGGSNLFSAYEKRLERTGHLLARTHALREVALSTRLHDTLFGLGNDLPIPQSTARLKEVSFTARKRFDMALTANVAFSNLLKRRATSADPANLLKSFDFLTVCTGVLHFTLEDAVWLSGGGRSPYNDFSIDDLTISEDMYLRSDVSTTDTMKVQGVQLIPVFNRRPLRIQETVSQIGLYQISGTMREWGDKIISQLSLLREDYPDKIIPREVTQTVFQKEPEWVNDDSGLIGRCLHETSETHSMITEVGLVTDDRRLANQMAQTCNVWVKTIKPEVYINWCIPRKIDYQDPEGSKVINKLSKELQRITQKGQTRTIDKLYIDTGSVSSAACQLEIDEEDPEGKTCIRKTPIETGFNSKTGLRYSRFSAKKVEKEEELLHLVVQPIAKAKKYRSSQGSLELNRELTDQIAMSSDSWRASGSSASQVNSSQACAWIEMINIMKSRSNSPDIP